MLRRYLTALLLMLGCFVSSTASAASLWVCVSTNDGHAPARWYFEAPTLHQAQVGAVNACVESGVTLHPTSCRILHCRRSNVHPSVWIPGHYEHYQPVGLGVMKP
jgi:hypothetical protein